LFCTVVINLHNLPHCTLTHIHTHTHTQHNQCCHWPIVYLDFMYVTGTSIVPNKTSENRGVFFLLLSRNIRIQKRLVQFKKAYIYIILIHDSYYNVHFINSFFFIISHFLKVFAFEGWLFKKFGMQIYTFFLVKVIKK